LLLFSPPPTPPPTHPPLSLHDALPILPEREPRPDVDRRAHLLLEFHERRSRAAQPYHERAGEPGLHRLAAGELGLPELHDGGRRSEEHTSELQSRFDLVCRLLLEKKKQ